MRHGLRHVSGIDRILPVALILALGAPSGPVFAQDSVDPELPASVYRERRERLMKGMKSCVGVLKSYSTESRIDADFFYLTGVKEPGAVLMLAPKEPFQRHSLFLTPRDPEAEIWTGYRDAMEPALRKKYEMDEVRRIRGALPRGFHNAMARAGCFAVLRPAFDRRPAIPPEELGTFLTAYEAGTQQRWQLIDDMRAHKDDPELARMRLAIEQTHQGQEAAIRTIAPGVNERVVQGAIEQAFYAAGATGLAFDTIVASGPNGAVLHWPDNDRTIERDELVLVDIGASYGEYAADVTRTFPASGKFSTEQRKTYDIVLGVQSAIIDAVKPGISLQELNLRAREKLEAAGHPFPHGIGHFVGLEVHDVGDSTRELEAGMVITVEPGIYIQDHYGIRIEDMLLVTRRGHEVLTRDIPRTADDVEAWMKRVRKASAHNN